MLERAGDEVGQRGGRLQRDPHQVAQLLPQLGVLPVADQLFRLGKLLLDRDHPLADLVQLLHDRQQLAEPQIQLFDQPHDLVAADDQPAPGGVLLGRRARCLSTAMRKSAWFSRSRCLIVARFGASRLSVRFFSAVLVTEISIVRSSRSSPCCTFSSSSTAAVQHEVVAQQQVAEAVRVSSIRRAEEISSGRDEHRNLAHLHQVHADRVVDVRFGAAVLRQVLEISSPRHARHRSGSSTRTSSSTDVSSTSIRRRDARFCLRAIAAPFLTTAVLGGAMLGDAVSDGCSVQRAIRTSASHRQFLAVANVERR